MQIQGMQMTEILEGPEAIVAAVARLGLGEPIAFPTETVYGLGADALDADAVERIFALKGRPTNNPLIVHVSGPEMARDLVGGVNEWTDDAEKLAEAFWPGSLTLVLNKDESVPDVVTAGGATVAIRCPAHPVALALIESLGKPIVGPSANPSGWISPTTADHVVRGFADEDLLVIDGGACRAGIESTVLDLTADEPTVLRLGVVSQAKLSRVLGRPVRVAGGAVDGSDTAVRSPGVLGAHYQPTKRTVLKATGSIADADHRVHLISWSRDNHDSAGGFTKMPPEPGGYARALYSAMHDAECSDASTIWIERPPESVDEEHEALLWDAIMERLTRATATHHHHPEGDDE